MLRKLMLGDSMVPPRNDPSGEGPQDAGEERLQDKAEDDSSIKVGGGLSIDPVRDALSPLFIARDGKGTELLYLQQTHEDSDFYIFVLREVNLCQAILEDPTAFLDEGQHPQFDTRGGDYATWLDNVFELAATRHLGGSSSDWVLQVETRHHECRHIEYTRRVLGKNTYRSDIAPVTTRCVRLLVNFFSVHKSWVQMESGVRSLVKFLHWIQI
jgi:hypothetical protein